MTLKKLFSDFTRLSSIGMISVLSLLLFACSPHPGAGHWKADGENSMNISWIDVVFEGTADIFEQGKQESIRRCFWSAADKNSLNMQCVHSDNTDNKATYNFVVLESGQAKLLQNDKLIGLFTEEVPPPKE